MALTQQAKALAVDEQVAAVIAERVAAVLRDDLEAIATELADSGGATAQLTVDQVARRLGVARSTVYAHWREWGGYKLGRGDKAPIRFDSASLPTVRSAPTPSADPTITPTRKRRRRRDLLVDTPRFSRARDEIG